MTNDEIQEALDNAVTTFAEKRGKLAYLAPYLKFQDKWSVEGMYPDFDMVGRITSKSFDTIAEALVDFQNVIDAMPDLHDQRMLDFQKSLAKLIEQGRDMQLDVSPLYALSKSLTENAIAP